MPAFQFLAPHNSNTPNNEYVDLEALQDVNIGSYAIVDRTFNQNGQQSNIFRHIYRFPNRTVTRGSIIRLISGRGINTTDTTSFKNTTRPFHTFYWNSDECVWNNNGDHAVLIQYAIDCFTDIPRV